MQRCIRSRNAADALKLLNAEILRPGLIITDIAMPDMDGFMLFQEVRKIAGCEAIPVIAATAHAMSGDKERVLAAGFDDYLSKPLDINRTVETVTKHLRREVVDHDTHFW